MIIIAGIAFLCGTLLLQQLSDLPSILWAWGLGPAVLLCWCLPKWRVVSVFFIGFLWALWMAQLRLGVVLPPALVGEDIVVEGYIASIPVVFDHGQRFEFEVVRGVDAELTADLPVPLKARINWYSYGNVQLPSLQVGDYWQLRLRLKPPNGVLNSGGFDYEAWLFAHDIRAVGYVRRSNQNQPLLNGADWRDVGRYPVQRLRQTLLQSLNALDISDRNRGVISALALGYRALMDADDWELLLSTGTNHLVAISGLHIGLIAGLFYWLTFWVGGWFIAFLAVRYPLWPMQRIAALLTFVGAFAYALMAGFSLPSQRALIMLAVGLVSLLFYTSLRPGRSLFYALLAVLIFDPFAANQPGFWLSFGAVGILLYIIAARLGADISPLSRLWRWGSIQWKLVLALLPVTLFWFGQAAFSSALANFVAIPLIGFLVVPLVLMATLASLFSPELASWFIFLVDPLLHLFWWVLEWVAVWPLGQWVQHAPPLWSVILAIIGVAILLAPRGLPGRWIGVFWLLPLFMARPVALPFGELSLSVLDVGQGTAVVAQTQNHVLVYDTGPKFGDRYDMGRVVLMPFLRHIAVDQVDTLLVSHGDNDHIGGALSLIADMPVKRVLTSVVDRFASADSCQAGQRWVWDGVQFEILHPAAGSGFAGNDGSCVLRIATAGASVLLPGDIEKSAERALLRKEMLKPTDIVVVPHHGSRTSSTAAFVAALSPAHAVATAGYRNRYGFPKPDIMQRYTAKGAAVWVSGLHGMLQFRLDAEGVRGPEVYRRTHAKFWHNRPGESW